MTSLNYTNILTNSEKRSILQHTKPSQNFNKIENMYSLEYTDIPKVFFMPPLTGRRSTDVIQGHCCNFDH
jgi:hypothetical protein